MKAMLLAAGFGTRLKPLTLKVPKPLLPLNGIPLIFYNLALLKHHGITQVVINLHHLGDQIQALLGDGSRWGFTFEYSHEPHILGTGGGIHHAKPLLRDQPQVIVMNGDIVTDVDLKALLEFHKTQAPLATLAVQQSPLAADFGILETNNQGELLSILGQPHQHPKSHQTFFTGVHVLSRDFFDWLYPKEQACIIRDAYIPMLKQGHKLMAFLYDGYWNDLGTHERFAQTSQALNRGKVTLSYQRELHHLTDLL